MFQVVRSSLHKILGFKRMNHLWSSLQTYIQIQVSLAQFLDHRRVVLEKFPGKVLSHVVLWQESNFSILEFHFVMFGAPYHPTFHDMANDQFLCALKFQVVPGQSIKVVLPCLGFSAPLQSYSIILLVVTTISFSFLLNNILLIYLFIFSLNQLGYVFVLILVDLIFGDFTLANLHRRSVIKVIIWINLFLLSVTAINGSNHLHFIIVFFFHLFFFFLLVFFFLLFLSFLLLALFVWFWGFNFLNRLNHGLSFWWNGR